MGAGASVVPVVAAGRSLRRRGEPPIAGTAGAGGRGVGIGDGAPGPGDESVFGWAVAAGESPAGGECVVDRGTARTRMCAGNGAVTGGNAAANGAASGVCDEPDDAVELGFARPAEISRPAGFRDADRLRH